MKKSCRVCFSPVFFLITKISSSILHIKYFMCRSKLSGELCSAYATHACTHCQIRTGNFTNIEKGVVDSIEYDRLEILHKLNNNKYILEN